VARRLGISRPTLTRLENADQNVTLKTLSQICRALRCRPGELFEPGHASPPSTVRTYDTNAAGPPVTVPETRYLKGLLLEVVE
jgi:transcriptional regulator with XRE-family HTH domain